MSEDLIRRSDAIKALDANFTIKGKENTQTVLNYLELVRTRIEGAPSIDIVRCKCDFGKCHEQGDTLYESSDWDGGIGFDYIRDIKYCPLCGGLLDGEEQTEREGE